MKQAVDDLLVIVNELIDNLGAGVVANGMAGQGWRRPGEDEIIKWIEHYFREEVFEDEFDAIMEEVYNEFYNIAAQNDYKIKTTY